MKHAVFPIIAFASCLALRAEPFSYSGKVVDSAGTGIPWAILKVVGSDAVGQSNADGSFTLTGNAVTALSSSTTDTALYVVEKKLCMDTINAYRAKLGLKAVTWSKSLEAFADQGARWDSEKNAPHAHFGLFSKGAIPSDAENEVPGWPLKSNKTVAAVVAKGVEMMWGEGPGGGHYENIKGNHAQVGCGIHVTAAGAVWVIHDFK